MAWVFGPVMPVATVLLLSLNSGVTQQTNGGPVMLINLKRLITAHLYFRIPRVINYEHYTRKS